MFSKPFTELLPSFFLHSLVMNFKSKGQEQVTERYETWK